ncbi:hypothetical protein [Desulfurivibrio alkaliphilus]|uniref:Lipoprotein n=1 Tax=Desulfurivibrio alkaliphilus (strain DSM 19089 / UNIQEM U267 / AHT2) TaxID=589865 RepID=D6Z5W5_DESAT|nr:hypothetical protein [Desulfurivibrio alkaliphilus]ADH84847.1 hypothetical protein DaAHT2_0134 [Desulfurivibrio alkaliphilus AHT 2]
MKEQSKMKWLGLAVVVTFALGLAGCSSSSSGGGGGNGEIDETEVGADQGETTSETYVLNEKEQAFVAALAGPGIMEMAQNFATTAAEVPDDPSGQPDEDSSGTSSVYSLNATTRVIVDGEVPVLFECPHPDAEGFVGEGALRFAEGNLIAINQIEFPNLFSNAGSLLAGQHADESGPDYAHDIYLRADCQVSAEDYDLGLLFRGGMDAAQLANVSGSGGQVVAAVIGDFTGTGVDDRPDASEFMESTFNYDLSGEPQSLTSLYRGEIYACTGCVAGNLADFSGNPGFDGTSQSFLEMSLQLPGGLEFEFQVGEDVNNPFTMQAAAAGNDQATVTMDGRLAYLEPSTGCGFDVTYQTVEPLLIQDYDQDNPVTLSGTLQVTVNETGNTYTVEFLNDQATVYDAAGNEVTPDTDPDALGCSV